MRDDLTICGESKFAHIVHVDTYSPGLMFIPCNNFGVGKYAAMDDVNKQENKKNHSDLTHVIFAQPPGGLHTRTNMIENVRPMSLGDQFK